MFTEIFSRPLRLRIGDRQLVFASIADFEFALASRTEIPATKVSTLLQLSSQQLRSEAARIRHVERHFVEVLARSFEEPGTIGGLLLELDLKLFSQDHDWRVLLAAVRGCDTRFDDFKKIALVKYVQYLAARQDVLRAIYLGRMSRDDESESTDEASERAENPSLRETVIFDLSRPADENEGETHLERLPVGEPVIVRPPPNGEIELVLSRHRFRVTVGEHIGLLDEGGQEYVLHRGRNAVGRQPGSDVVINPSYRDISRQHLLLEVGDEPMLVVTDLSSHGTFVRSGTSASS